MILELSTLCLLLLQIQQPDPNIEVEESGLSLGADSISSTDIENGIRYELENFQLSTENLQLSAQSAVVEICSAADGAADCDVAWGAALLRGLGFDSDNNSLQLVEISNEVMFKDPRFQISADKLILRPNESIGEFIEVRATFADNTIGPNGWPILITADKLLEMPGGVLEFHHCTFSTCLNEPQHYSTSFELLRATKLGDGRMSWQSQGAWLNIYGLPLLPLPSPDFIDGEDFLGLKSINFGSSRITGNVITPKFGGKTEFNDQRNIDWSISPGFSDLRGLPLTFDTTYIDKDYFSSLKGFFLSDRSSDFHRLGNSIARENDQRYLVNWHNHWQLDKRWALNADLALMSDHLVYPEFFHNDWVNNDDAESSIELFNRADNHFFSAAFTFPNLGAGYTPLAGFAAAPGAQGQYLSYQPRAKYTSHAILGEGWRPSWLNTSWGMEAGRMTLQDYGIDSASSIGYLSNPSASRSRFSSWADARANFSIGGINLAPAVTIRASTWRDSSPVVLNDQQLFVESSLSSNAILIQRYDDGWTHKVIPSISLRSQHAFVAADNTPRDFDGNDVLQEGRLVELSMRQFFYAPNADSPWLDMQLLQPYYLTPSTALGSSLMPFRTTNVDSGLGPSEMRMKWTPSAYGGALKGISVLMNLRYDFEADRVDEVLGQISMRPDSNYFYGVNYLETNGTAQDFALGSAYAGLRISEEWASSIRKSRNFSGDAGFFSTWEVTHYGHDFSFEVGYTRVESTGADGFYFSISPRFVHDKFNSFDYNLR